ncbi:MAG TPA: flagellar export chaperone FliS [Tepidisphaeraceae bacterium]|jgi:flagellar protein FliS|nr:flagellar export chaperone FliS [Tepidisphaeraceae bacterium]
MNPQAAQQNYLRTRVLTATPEQLQMMLYDGAIRFADGARTALLKKDWEGVYKNCSRAQKIVTELSAALKRDVAPDLCHNLGSLYNYIFRQLMDASLNHTVESIDEALKMLRYQRDTWAMLMEQLGKEKAAGAAAKVSFPEPNPRMEAALSVQG